MAIGLWLAWLDPGAGHLGPGVDAGGLGVGHAVVLPLLEHPELRSVLWSTPILTLMAKFLVMVMTVLMTFPPALLTKMIPVLSGV